MRLPRSTRALIAITWIAIAAGCYSPRIENGTLACAADNRCPRGFTCSGGRCYTGVDAAVDAGAESRAKDGAGESLSIDAGMEGRPIEAGTGGGAGGRGGTSGTGGAGAGGRGGTSGTAGAGATGGGAGATGGGAGGPA